MSGAGGEDELAGGQFDIFPLAFEDYRANPRVEGAEAEAGAIAEALRDFGVSTVPWQPGPRNLSATTRRLKAWERQADRNSMLLWIGHGTSFGERGRLFVPGEPAPEGEPEADEEFLVGNFAAHLESQAGRRRATGCWTIVVVEACGAARYVELAHQRLITPQATEGLLLIGSGNDSGRGYLGQFRRVLRQIYGDGSGLRLTTNDTEVSLQRLGYMIREELGPNGHVVLPPVTDRPARLMLASAPIMPLTTPLDSYGRLRQDANAGSLGMADDTGGAGFDLGEIGVDFVGRAGDRETLHAWLSREDGGLLIVTGPPGCGKSALISQVVRERRDAKPGLDASLLLRGVDLADVIGRLGEQFGVGPEMEPSSEHAVRSGLLDALRNRTGTARLAVDGLDEAADPHAVAGLLDEMVDAGVRVLVGTRPGLGDDGNADEPADDLLRALGAGRPHVTHHRLRRDPEAIAQYVRRRLGSADVVRALEAAKPGSRADHLIGIAAERITTQGLGGQCDFLFARLIVQEVLADPALLTPRGDARFAALLTYDHEQLFDVALGRISDVLPSTVPILLALACARGRGIPHADGVWLAAANAFSAPGEPLAQGDLDAVIEAAAPYIMLDYAAGESVFRLAHGTFRAPLEAGRTASSDLLVGRALLALAQARDEMPSYVRSHVSGHLSQAGAEGWLELAGRPAVLDRLPVPALVRDALAGEEPLILLPREIQGVIQSGHLSATASAADRPGLRELGTARLQGFWPDKGDGSRRPPADGWSVLSARLVRQQPHVVLKGHADAVTGLAVARGPGGSTRLVSAGRDGTVRLWNLASGAAVRPRLTAIGAGVLAFSVLRLYDGTEHLVCTMARAPELRLVDLAAGTVIRERGTGSTGQFLPFRTRDGPLRLAGVESQGLTVRDGLTLRPLLTALTGQRRAVGSIAVLTDAGDRALIANAGPDGVVRLWDPDMQCATGDPARLRPVHALTATTRSGAVDLVFAGHDDGTVTAWDPESGETWPLPGPDEAVSSLTSARLGTGSALVVAGLADGSVRWWAGDADRGPGAASSAPWSAGTTLRGHDGRVRSVLISERAGSARGVVTIASGGEDGSIRLWDVDVNAIAGDGAGPAAEGVRPAVQRRRSWVPGWSSSSRVWRLTRRSGAEVVVRLRADGAARWQAERHEIRVPAVGVTSDAVLLTTADGQEIVALARQDLSISAWGLTSGRSCGPPMRGHSGWIRALTAVEDGAGGQWLVSGGDDATVRVWRPGLPSPVRVIPLDAGVVGLSPNPSRGIDVQLVNGSVTIWVGTAQAAGDELEDGHD